MFIGPVYTLRNGGVSISTAITALQLKCGANGIIEVIRASVSQQPSVTSTQINCTLGRKSAAATVTAATAGANVAKHNPASPTADCTLGTAATGFTASAEGTDSDFTIQRGVNTLNGFEYLPTPEERLVVPIAGFIALKFLVAPISATYYADITFRELRGA